MGFSEQAKAGQSSRTGEPVPLRLLKRAETQLTNDSFEEFTKARRITQRICIAAVGVNNPLDSIHK